MKKLKKGIGVLKKFQMISPRKFILRIYQSLNRLHLDYKDTIYSKISNECFSKKVQSYQYNTALTITSAIRSASVVKSYDESILEFLNI